MPKNVEKVVRCPQCGKPAHWSKRNRFKPFCTEQCKLIDLGQWLDEEVRIPGESIPIRRTDNDRAD